MFYKKKNLEDMSIKELEDLKYQNFIKSEDIIDRSKIELIMSHLGKRRNIGSYSSIRIYSIQSGNKVLIIVYDYYDTIIYLLPLEQFDYFNNVYKHISPYFFSDYIVYSPQDLIYVPGEWTKDFQWAYKQAEKKKIESEEKIKKEQKKSLIKEIKKMGIR